MLKKHHFEVPSDARADQFKPEVVGSDLVVPEEEQPDDADDAHVDQDYNLNHQVKLPEVDLVGSVLYGDRQLLVGLQGDCPHQLLGRHLSLLLRLC